VDRDDVRLAEQFIFRNQCRSIEQLRAICRLAKVLPLEQVAEGYRAMDERRAIKTLLRP
jgi:hypothetical protein